MNALISSGAGRWLGGRRGFPAALLAAALACLILTPAARAEETLQVTGSLWSPYIDGDLPEAGLATDLVRTGLTRAGFDIQANVETWSRAYQGVAVGVYDVVVSVWETRARSEDLLFSEPYLMNDIVFLSRADLLVDYQGPADLIGYRIGVERDFAYDEAFDSDPNLTRVVNDHLIQNLLLLRQGKLDLLVGDKWSILYQISEFMPADISAFRILSKPLIRRALRMGVSRTNPNAQEIVSRFDAAMKVMREDGTYNAIVKKHTDGIAVLPSRR
ncbi:MAG: substrate-binding periplasmic protein [Pseudomonadales bacterium]